MKTKLYEDEMSCRSCVGRIETRRTDNGECWLNGTVLTPHGIVDIYAEDETTRFDFCCNGRLYMRTYHRRYSQRGIVTLAGRMARDISANVGVSDAVRKDSEPSKTTKPKTGAAAERQRRSLQAVVRAMRSAQKKMDAYWKEAQAAEADARSSDARWNEKNADYWKGRHDGLRSALELIGPNAESSHGGKEPRP